MECFGHFSGTKSQWLRATGAENIIERGAHKKSENHFGA